MKIQWVWLALIVSSVFAAMQLMFGVKITTEDTGLPLLMVLLMNELGFVLCALAGWFSVNSIKKTGMNVKLAIGTGLCTAFAVGFLFNLIRLFPTTGL